MSIQAMKQAREVIELGDDASLAQRYAVLTNIDQAIAEAEKQEPNEALRLADALEREYSGCHTDEKDFLEMDAAAELRRLHEENRKLKSTAPVQEPVAQDVQEKCRIEVVPAKGSLLPTPQPQREPPDDGFTQALIERDEYHAIADELAEMIAHITGEDIGEHTSANFPWRNALDAAENWLCHPTPPQREWVGLTDEEIDKTHETQVWDARRSYARAIEAKLKQKNGCAEEKNT